MIRKGNLKFQNMCKTINIILSIIDKKLNISRHAFKLNVTCVCMCVCVCVCVCVHAWVYVPVCMCQRRVGVCVCCVGAPE